MPPMYSFVSRWHLPVAPEAAWSELARTLEPGSGGARWWPGFALTMAPRRVTAGERMIITVRSPLGYALRLRLEITDAEPGRSITARSEGDLRGQGSVEVQAAAGGASVVVFHWDVETRRPWMNATAWLLRPVFEHAHTRVMRRGERGLRTELRERRSELRNAGNAAVAAAGNARSG
jgi:hypothetical protein